MDTQSIIAELEAERDRLDQAIAALRGRQTKSLTLSGKPDGRRRKKAYVSSGPAEDRSGYEEALGRTEESGLAMRV